MYIQLHCNKNSKSRQVTLNIFDPQKLYIQILETHKQQQMRRGSIKKSSNFKIQAQKNVFKTFLSNINECQTVKMYPELLDTIKMSGQTVYDYCYSFSDQSPFLRGLNYAGKTYGFSTQSSSIINYREWLPNIKEAYLLGQFNNYNQKSHQLKLVEGETEFFQISLQVQQQKLVEQSKLLLRLIDKQGIQLKMTPPSCQARSGGQGVFCMDLCIQKAKHSKRQQILLAYTLDLNEIPLNLAEQWVQQNMKELSEFNTIIIRNLFQSGTVLKKSFLQIQQMKQVYELINCIKQKLSFKVLIEWVFQNSFDQKPENPIQKQLLKQNQQGRWEYNFSNKEVLGFYLSKISFYLSTFQIDGFHFKQIDSVFRSKQGQVLLKCISIMHNRLLDNSCALASCKKQIPGMNQPILEGGLGFSFTYNYGQDFLRSENHKQFKNMLDNILKSSNCVPIDLNKISEKLILNFIFAVFTSQKGIFCKGQIGQYSELLKKILRVRKQLQLFSSPAVIQKIADKFIHLKRARTQIFFNFGDEQICQKIESCQNLELIFSYGDQPTLNQNQVNLAKFSCSIFQEIDE